MGAPNICSLYFHIPFCASCCDYCDFYSIPVPPGDPRPLVFADALITLTGDWLRRFGVTEIPTVYIGGGTPSILGAAGLRQLLGGLASLWSSPPVELTLEVNPESAGEDLLDAAREGGVTRLSVGVQSFHGPSRGALNRGGDPARLPDQLRLVQEAFPGSFSVDLIAGLPFQNRGILLSDIERLLSFEPAHVSLYALTVEEGTPLAETARQPGFLPSPEEADLLWITGRDALEDAGYAQYEVSNFALPGKRSRHNIRYWRMENWLGIGPAASGTLINDGEGTGRRYTWPPDAGAWLPGGTFPEAAEDELDPQILMKESLLMGFRYIEGPDEALFAHRFRRTIKGTIPRTIAVWRNRGFFAGETLAPSPQGLLFLDPFLRDAFGEIGN